MEPFPQPIEKQRKGNHPYRFKILEDFSYADSGWGLAAPFESKWLHISQDGVITVKANESGYAWDGCTPKWSFLNVAIVGVPDGHIDHRTMKPFTYYASLVHDALYQYLDTVPISKAEIDLLFLRMLGDFKLAKIYYLCVKHFGARRVKQTGLAQALHALSPDLTTPPS